MESKGHFLQPHKRAEQWHNLIFLSVESRRKEVSKGNWEHHFRLAHARYHNVRVKTDKTKNFTRSRDVWQWITDKATPSHRLYVFSHNLYFDLKVSQGHLWFPEHGWQPSSYWFSDNGPQSFACFRKDKRTVWLICSQNYFPVDMAVLGKLVGTHYTLRDTNSEDKETTMAVCVKKVDIVSQVMQEFFSLLHKEDIGNPAKTMAGIAMSAYKHRHLQEPIWIYRNNKAATLEIASYHGGRVECFNVGTYHGKYWLLDVRSMYPYLMRTKPYPTHLLCYQEHSISQRYVATLLDKHYVIADVTISTQDAFYPFVTLGNQKPDNDDGTLDPLERVGKPGLRTCFPQGTFRTVLCGETLKRAYEQDAIVKMHRIAIYRQGDIFSSYVDAMWARRQKAQRKGNKVYAEVWKRMLNLLQGKFGQRVKLRLGSEPGPIEDFYINYAYYEKELVTEWHCFGAVTSFGSQRVLSYDSLVAISAAVADYGRNYLWALMLTAGLRNCLYCDTDSLMVSEEGRDNLQGYIGSGLGALKVDAKGPKVVINAPKDYKIGNKVRQKGVRPGAVWDAFLGVYHQNFHESIYGALQNHSGGLFLEREMKISPATDIWGRQVMPDGSTRTWTIGQPTLPAIKIVTLKGNKKAA